MEPDPVSALHEHVRAATRECMSGDKPETSVRIRARRIAHTGKTRIYVLGQDEPFQVDLSTEQLREYNRRYH